MFFPILVSVLFSKTPYLLILVGGIGGQGEIKIASASTPSANEQAKDVVLVQVISGADRHLDITFGLQVVESSSLVSVLFREALNHPYISFFQLLVNGFSVIYMDINTDNFTPLALHVRGNKFDCTTIE